ncbi:MAG: hypothetical protein FWC39_06510 [Bacteroidetes bacterium]|nr:hypothetical protein [Bacteroidota bacterium]MCL2328152.1 hypothetical protein [Bacteroidota bacterium]
MIKNKKFMWTVILTASVLIGLIAIFLLFSIQKQDTVEFLEQDTVNSLIVKNEGDLTEINRNFSDAKNLSEFEKTDFIPTLEHTIDARNNAVYCVTLLYAWDEVRKLIDKPLTISPNDTDLLLLNNSQSFMYALKNGEYSTSSEIIGNTIKAKAEFSKSLPFEVKLNSYDKKLKFKGEKVASFGVTGYSNNKQLKIVEIVYYKNDNNFIIKLLPKDKTHEIILFKTNKVFNSMVEMNEEIIKLTEIGKKERRNEKSKWKYYINSDYNDEVVIPKFKFNIETNYATLEGNKFNAAQQAYRIRTAWQRTAFLLDESGAEIESEAVVMVDSLSRREEEEEIIQKPKKMIFDKDFLILLKRTDSRNPYFGLWVTNTELMVK